MQYRLAILAALFIPLASCGAGRRVDPELEMVRTYLRENLNDPTWQEVKWWPARDLVERKREAIEEYREKLADAKRRLAGAAARGEQPGPIRAEIDRWQESFKNAEASKPVRICRLKYRTKIGGSPVLFDEVFCIQGKEAKPADEALPAYPGYWKQYFDQKQTAERQSVEK